MRSRICGAGISMPRVRFYCKTRARFSEFAGAVLCALDRVLAVHGLDGYKDRWVEHEFPEVLRAGLRSRLESTER